jgi:spermidine synthase
MAKAFEELDYQQTSLGELSLRRKHIAMLGDLEVHEVMLGESFLMSSLFHAVEDALAELGLRELGGIDCDVIVGGLGLGYTAVAALAHPNLRSLLVVEYLAPVIGWHRRGLVPLGAQLVASPRCTFLENDFFALARSTAGFAHGRKFHAVLLDIDHSPRNFLHAQNAAFYEATGLTALAAHIHPGGVFAMWSDDPPDAEFLAVLQTVFAAARAEIVKFPNPLLDCESASTVYIARKASI